MESADSTNLRWFDANPWNQQIADSTDLQWFDANPWTADCTDLQWFDANPWIADSTDLQWFDANPWTGGEALEDVWEALGSVCKASSKLGFAVV